MPASNPIAWFPTGWDRYQHPFSMLELPGEIDPKIGKTIVEGAIDRRIGQRRRTTRKMYLISWIEEESKLETSLGGRVTAEEMKVVYEELQEILSDVEEQPYLMVLDYSRAKAFDVEADMILLDIKEFCLQRGAEKVVSVVRDTDEIVAMTSKSLQNVLVGMEDFVTDPSVIKWTPTVAVSDIVRRAA